VWLLCELLYTCYLLTYLLTYLLAIELGVSIAVVQMVYTSDGWCRLVIRDVMLEDEGEYTVKAVNEAGTCISTAYLTVLRTYRLPTVTFPAALVSGR